MYLTIGKGKANGLVSGSYGTDSLVCSVRQELGVMIVRDGWE
jgi:hypothetical protein